MQAKLSILEARCAPRPMIRFPRAFNYSLCGLSTRANLSPPRPVQRVQGPLSVREPSEAGGKEIHKAALALRKQGDLAGALDILEQGIQEFPDNVYLLTTSAVIQGKVGEVEAAEKLFRKVVGLDPGNSTALQVISIVVPIHD